MSAPHLLHVFPSFVPAGSQVRTCGLLRDLGTEFRHSIVALDGRTDAAALLPAGIDVQQLSPPRKAGTALTALRMAAVLWRERPDLVLTYNFGSLDTVLAAKATALAPVVHHEDGFNPDEAQRLKRRRVWYRRAVLPGVAGVVVISQNLERIALEVFHLPRDLVHFIPNGVDSARFELADGRSELRRALGIAQDAIVVGAVGHLRAEKNYARLLAAAARAVQVANVHVLMLGDGPERARLEALAAEPALAGRVTFAGYHADPREHYRALDVFALSSDTEQMPLSLLEAMASGLPVISTRVGDIPSILGEHQQQSVIALGPECEVRFAHALIELAQSPDLRRELGRQNRRTVEERFTRASMRDRYRALYRAALGPRKDSMNRPAHP